MSGVDMRDSINLGWFKQHLLDEITTELAQGDCLEFQDLGVLEPRTHRDTTSDFK